LIDAVIVEMKRRLTEARLQMLAADMAMEHISADAEVDLPQIESARRALADLESRVQEMETKKDLLLVRMRNADARLAIEKAMMELDNESGDTALDRISERLMNLQSQAEAVEAIRHISDANGGANGG
jgi:phage shock protein A